MAGASAVTENLIPAITGKKLEWNRALWATRVMVIVNAVIALAIGLWAQTIYELSILAWSLLLVGLFIPFSFGMYWKKANSWGAVAAFSGGFFVWILATYFFFNSGLGGPDGTRLLGAAGGRRARRRAARRGAALALPTREWSNR